MAPKRFWRIGAYATVFSANENWTILKKIQVFINKDRHNTYGAVEWRKNNHYPKSF